MKRKKRTPTTRTEGLSRRQKRVASEVSEILSGAILLQLADPRVKGISVTHVEVTGDLHHARIFITSSGGKAAMQSALEGLKTAGGFLRHKLAEQMTTRKVPDLQFFPDDTIYKAWQLDEVISTLDDPQGDA